MDPQDDPSAYLASLLASTSPTHARPVQARGTYTQPAVPFNYPLSDVREQPPFGATQGSINPNLPYGHNRNLAQPAAAAIVPQPNPRTGSFAQQYQSYPYLASSLAHYQPYQDLPLGETALQTHGQDDSSLDDVIPGERTVSQDIDSEEEEGEEKPGRNLRQIRKKRKQTPVLVFDDDSDDVDYKEAPSKGTKRTKYDYDSEGAIDADAARSSSEEASEPATGPQGGFPNSNSRSKLNLKSTRYVTMAGENRDRIPANQPLAAHPQEAARHSPRIQPRPKTKRREPMPKHAPRRLARSSTARAKDARSPRACKSATRPT